MPREAFVIRGGLSTAEQLIANAEAHAADPETYGEWALSLQVIEDDLAAVEDIVASNPDVVHGKYRYTTVGQLADERLPVLRDDPRHALAILPGSPAEYPEAIEAFMRVLSDPQPNPYAQSRKRRPRS